MLKQNSLKEAKSRIPAELRQKGMWQTFYSTIDQWLMHMIFDERTCDVCFNHEAEYAGSQLRSVFPYHEIQTEELIYAKVHPYCRCRLVRVPRPEDIRYQEGGYLEI